MQTATNLQQGSQRGFVRVRPETHAGVTVHINGSDFIEIQKVVDISEGGIRLRVPHRFEGCHIDGLVGLVITLPLSDTKPFRLEGRIRHIHEDTFGIQFAGCNDKSRQLLRRYIALRLRVEDGFFSYLKFQLGMTR
jgi:hypothetical protein